MENIFGPIGQGNGSRPTLNAARGVILADPTAHQNELIKIAENLREAADKLLSYVNNGGTGSSIRLKSSNGETPIPHAPRLAAMGTVDGKKCIGVLFITNGIVTAPYPVVADSGCVANAAPYAEFNTKPKRKRVRKKRKVVMSSKAGLSLSKLKPIVDVLQYKTAQTSLHKGIIQEHQIAHVPFAISVCDTINLRNLIMGRSPRLEYADSQEVLILEKLKGRSKTLAEILYSGGNLRLPGQPDGVKARDFLLSWTLKLPSSPLPLPAQILTNMSGENVCYINAAIQFLIGIPVFTRYILATGFRANEEYYPFHRDLFRAFSALAGLSNLDDNSDRFMDIALSESPDEDEFKASSCELSAKGLMPYVIKYWEKNRGQEEGEQADSAEFLSVLLDGMSRELTWYDEENGRNSNIIDLFFAIHFSTQRERTADVYIGDVDETNSSLKIEDLLMESFRGRTVQSLPPVLLVNIGRVTFDKVVKRPRKSEMAVQSPEIIAFPSYWFKAKVHDDLFEDIGGDAGIVQTSNEANTFGISYYKRTTLIHEGSSTVSGHYVAVRHDRKRGSVLIDEANIRIPDTASENQASLVCFSTLGYLTI